MHCSLWISDVSILFVLQDFTYTYYSSVLSAVQFEIPRMSIYKSSSCYNCDLQNHKKNVCSELSCIYCKKKNHIITEYLKYLICANCYQKNHSDKCRKKWIKSYQIISEQISNSRTQVTKTCEQILSQSLYQN